MHNRLSRVFAIYLLAVFIGEIPIAQAGFDHFTVIDSLGNWRIEQKFDAETKKIFCRAFVKGNGTWFAEKIRINQNDELIFPEGISFKDISSSNDVKKVRALLQDCRKGLFYLPRAGSFSL